MQEISKKFGFTGISRATFAATAMALFFAATAPAYQASAQGVSIEDLDNINREMERLRAQTDLKRAEIDLRRAEKELEEIMNPTIITDPNDPGFGGGFPVDGGFPVEPQPAPIPAPQSAVVPPLGSIEGVIAEAPPAPRVVAIMGVAGQPRAELLFSGHVAGDQGGESTIRYAKKIVSTGERVDRHYRVTAIADDFVEFENIDDGSCVTMIVGADFDALSQERHTLTEPCRFSSKSGTSGAAVSGAGRGDGAGNSSRSTDRQEKDTLPFRF